MLCKLGQPKDAVQPTTCLEWFDKVLHSLLQSTSDGHGDNSSPGLWDAIKLACNQCAHEHIDQ